MNSQKIQNEIYPYNKMKLDDAIRYLDYKDKRAQIAWCFLEKNGKAKANRARLSHLCDLFEQGRISKAETTYFPALIKSVEVESKNNREKCMPRFAKAIRLFANHGSKKESEVRRHLNFFKKNGGDFYHWLLEDLEEALVCEKALKEKDYIVLFHSLLRALHRSISNLRTQYTKKRRASIWLLRATEDDGFTEWLLKLKRVPKRPKGFEKLDGEESAYIFNKFEHSDSSFELTRRFWNGSHRNALHVLFLNAGKHFKMKDGRHHDPFLSMTRVANLAAMDYLFELGITSDSLSESLQVATINPKSLEKLVNEYVLTTSQLSNAMMYLCGSQLYFNSQSYRILKKAGIKVCNKNKGTTYFHIAVWNSNTPAIRMLLDDGVDPFKTNSKGKTGIEMSRVADTSRLLNQEIKNSGIKDNRDTLTEFTNSDAMALFKKNEKSFSTTEKKTIRKVFQDGKIPLKLSSQEIDSLLLSRALVGNKSTTIKAKDLHIKKDTVVTGNLNVSGCLIITANNVVVLGNLKAATLDVDETGDLSVAGSLSAKAIYAGGYISVADSIDAKVVVGFDGGVIRTDRFQADLMVLYAYCTLDATHKKGKLFNIPHSGEESEAYRNAENTIAKSCLSENPRLGVGKIDFTKLTEAAVKGRRYLRK